MGARDYANIPTLINIGLAAVIIALGFGLWIPSFLELQKIRQDEIKFFTSPVYCDISARLCNISLPIHDKCLETVIHTGNITIIVNESPFGIPPDMDKINVSRG